MIHLKDIHSSLTLKQHAFLNRNSHFQRKKHPILCLCKRNDSDSDAPPPPPQGDSRQQELLARIAQLQTQKVRLTDYLDERSAYLSQFAEDANAEIDQIGENALKELDEAGSRIMENIESRMQAFEESTELNKQEIEENEKKLADFEGQMEEERNEGLFFKNLGQKQSVDKAKAKEETDKIKQLSKENAESKTRRNIYLALIGLVVVGITNALISSPSDWTKSAVLGAILVGLLSQVIYEQSVLSETETKQKQTSEEEKK
ncbi:PREDICTED: uncharacterized protein LOC109216329 [Nicotiana attenuata]|uniref:Uncharacterized protein n=1 Tax=Nicotiana attenuata TaxID=49451 RepID=A0A1J6K4N6_NICAT|nr:PREDICTED: uncharacterized protein LOC109216329 [Nicotiana attenuata]OIT24302.1 hypothetical protein A4A49_34673 [Nicotiana attenuata]